MFILKNNIITGIKNDIITYEDNDNYDTIVFARRDIEEVRIPSLNHVLFLIAIFFKISNFLKTLNWN